MVKKRKSRRNRNQKRKQRGRTRQPRPKRTQVPAASGVVLRNQRREHQYKVHGREYIQDVVSAGTGDQRIKIAVNPGVSTVFPWLSIQAAGYETYRFENLQFSFCTAATTSNAGSVALCVDYDPEDNNTSLTKGEMYAFDDTVRFPVWSSGTLKCRKTNLQKRKQYYTRDATFGTLRLKEYDTCNLYVLFTSTDSITIGDIWVDYDVVFYTPQRSARTTVNARIATANPSGDDHPFTDNTKADNLALIVQNAGKLIKVTDWGQLAFAKAGRYLVEIKGEQAGGNITGLITPTPEDAKAAIVDYISTISSGGTVGTNSTLIDVLTGASPLDPALVNFTDMTATSYIDQFYTNIMEVDPTIVTHTDGPL